MAYTENKAPFPDALGVSNIDRREGFLVSMGPSTPEPWAISLGKKVLYGGPRRTSLMVTAGDDGKPYVALMGIQRPMVAPVVSGISPGRIGAQVQLAVRLKRSRDGQCSAISPVWPPANPDIVAGTTGNGYIDLDAQNKKVAQSFVPVQSVTIPNSVSVPLINADTYVAVMLRLTLRKVGSPDTRLRVALYRDNGTGLPDLSQRLSGYSTSYPAARLFTGADRIVDFVFTSRLLMPNDGTTRFHAVLEPDGSGTLNAANYVRVARQSGNPYAAGQASTYNGTVWTASAGNDLVATIFGEVLNEHAVFADCTSLGLTVTNLASYAAQAKHDSFDTIEVVAQSASVEGNVFFVVAETKVDFSPRFPAPPTSQASSLTLNEAFGTFDGEAPIVPGANAHPGGFLQCLVVSNGTEQRWVGFGRPGFDPYTDTQLLDDGLMPPMTMYIDSNSALNGVASIGFALEQYLGNLITVYRTANTDLQQLYGQTWPNIWSEAYRGVVRRGVNSEQFICDVSGSLEPESPSTGYKLVYQIRPRIYMKLTANSATVTLYQAWDDPPAPIASTGSPTANTVVTTDPHGLYVGDLVQVDGLGKASDGVYEVANVVSPTEVQLLDYPRGPETVLPPAGSIRRLEPAYYAEPWMIGTALSLGDGVATSALTPYIVEAVNPRGRKWPTPYPGMDWFASDSFVLNQNWTGETVFVDFALRPDYQTLQFSMGAPDAVEGTGYFLSQDIRSQAPLQALGWVRQRLVAFSQSREYFVVQFGNFADPTSGEEAAAGSPQDLGGVVIERREATFPNFRPVNICYDQDGTMMAVCASGIWAFDGTVFRDLTASAISERFDGYDRSTLAYARGIVDPEHAFGPAVRMIGMGLQGDYHDNFYLRTGDRPRNTWDNPATGFDLAYATQPAETVTWGDQRPRANQQIVLRTDTGSFYDFTGHFLDSNAGCCVNMVDGTRRPMLLGNGRLHLYGSPARPGQNVPGREVYTLETLRTRAQFITGFPAARIKAQLSGDPQDTISFLATDIDSLEGSFAWLTQAGVVVTKIDEETNEWQKAEVLFPGGMYNITALTGDGTTATVTLNGNHGVPVDGGATTVLIQVTGVSVNGSFGAGSFNVVAYAVSPTQLSYASAYTSGYDSGTGVVDIGENIVCTVLLRRLTDWTVEPGKTYSLVFGARECALTLPTIQTSQSFGLVTPWQLLISVEDNNGNTPFDYPIAVTTFWSDGHPAVQAANTQTVHYSRTSMYELFQSLPLGGNPSHEFFVRIAFIAPPDSNLFFKRITYQFTETAV